MEALLSLTGVEVMREGRTILGPLDFAVNEGERWVILGPNGAGKTTLLQLLAALIHPTRGDVRILGERMGSVDVFELRPRIGFTSSAMLELLPADEKVIDIVLTSAYAIAGRWIEDYDLWDESRAKALLTTFGVRELGERTFGTLSEGEKKRVQISRALMADPEVLLLDEPAAGLDLGGREDILQRITSYTSDDNAPATIIVTHHIEEIPAGTTHALLLKNGKALYAGSISDVLTETNINEVFGVNISLTFNGRRYFASTQI
ncbi:MAG: ABC transporter ATP-binding protein [Actinobacteria bacterium]|jgi:iron complex transport system ATP-binding protein|nr:ABC transporter ATP-binding protein [Actinomycetota bacterium]NCU89871.1 ABC transporter ATP-binding protein [Actinomycetota bacterium]NDE54531.1 ABC transporter ATP-binding protein [Actinomycetota bacterium]